MSASSVRRLKERGGGGGKISASSATTAPATGRSSKSLTPVSEKSVSITGNGPQSLRRSASGKENPLRPSSRPRAAAATSARPTIRSMPRIDKPSAMGVGENGAPGEARARWSTSSSLVPRGRSPSPSEFTRVLSDMKKGGSRVSVDRSVQEKRAVNSRVLSEQSDTSRKIRENGKWGLDKSERKETFRINGSKSVEAKKFNLKGMKSSDGNEITLNGNIDSGEKDCVFEEAKVKPCIEKSVKLLGSIESTWNCTAGSSEKNLEEAIMTSCNNKSDEQLELKESLSNSNVELSEQNESSEDAKGKSSIGKNVESLGSKESRLSSNEDLSQKINSIEEEKVTSSSEKSGELGSKGVRMEGRMSGVSGILKEKGVSEQVKTSALSGHKYPSKLHEKLAFLEGKVKRIASDIKKTKEMLDMNNPDASKVILTDIQEKISGIEKAMGNVIGGGDLKIGVVKVNENDDGKTHESVKQEETQIVDGKNSVKGLSADELEARLFPHHKLLRGRACLQSSSEISQTEESGGRELTCQLKTEDKSTSLIEENPIALEFLATLNREQSSFTEKIGNDNSEIIEVQETDGALTAGPENSSSTLIGPSSNLDTILTADEKLDDFDDQENRSRMVIEEEPEDNNAYILNEIGHKSSTGGWFVSDGDSVLLAHADGSCSYYDIANCEKKAEYRPPVGIPSSMWRDCWIVRAPSADGCSGRYVVAASAGNSIDSGFCSWDFYSKDVRAFHIEDGTANVRTALADLPNNAVYRRNSFSSNIPSENQQWWFKPCGPLIVSTASCQRVVRVYDIRDGEHIMRWELQKPVASMEYSSPLQWRNRGKVVVAEAETVSLWDVSSLNPQPLLSVPSSNRKISALHVNNTDAELGGGVRQRVTSSEVEGNDGVFCTADSINVLDFRQPSGIGLKIPNKLGVNVQSAFSRGDSILLGCTSLKSAGKNQFASQIQQFSLRTQKLLTTYAFPESNAHSHYKAITQVWGNSSTVMGACGLGLFTFDANVDNVKDIIGPDDMYHPSFDYLSSRVLLISRDRPAMWRYVS